MVALNTVVYNEVHRLPEMIRRANHWASEMVIVDQQSNDGTWEWLLQNATKMDLTIIRDKHWGYCEPSRKLAWKATKSNWIGVLDADERFSDEAISDFPKFIEAGRSAKLKRAFYLAGEHRFTGDYQYRFFSKKNVRFLNEIHTDPQIIDQSKVFWPEYVGIIHEKSWVEQIRDELAYEQIISNNKNENNPALKLSLNVHLKLLREKGITPEEADAMSIEERIERGIGNA